MIIMEKSVKESMFTYYDERAREYDEIYTLGKGPASINDPQIYKEETQVLQRVVNEVCRGKLLDIPCGTAFWLPSYAEKCGSFYLFDQSENMLEQARMKAILSGIDNRCTYGRGDILDDHWETGTYDSILIGFFISHLTESQENLFFTKLCKSLSPEGRFLILDSVWTETRSKTRGKSGNQKRRLNDGTEFEIYKKYFDRPDIDNIGVNYGFKIDLHHFGETFCGFSGRL